MEISAFSRKRRDEITEYAGLKVQIGFLHKAYSGYGCGNRSSGWYIDDVQIFKKVPEFTGDFESGWDDWGAGRGVWEVGTPTVRPPACYTGDYCAGTVLDGNYPSDTDSRIATPPIGTGPGNLSIEDAARVMVDVLSMAMASAIYPQEVCIVVDSEEDKDLFDSYLKRVPQ